MVFNQSRLTLIIVFRLSAVTVSRLLSALAAVSLSFASLPTTAAERRFLGGSTQITITCSNNFAQMAFAAYKAHRDPAQLEAALKRCNPELAKPPPQSWFPSFWTSDIPGRYLGWMRMHQCEPNLFFDGIENASVIGQIDRAQALLSKKWIVFDNPEIVWKWVSTKIETAVKTIQNGDVLLGQLYKFLNNEYPPAVSSAIWCAILAEVIGATFSVEVGAMAAVLAKIHHLLTPLKFTHRLRRFAAIAPRLNRATVARLVRDLFLRC
jgi:hypothetical protein